MRFHCLGKRLRGAKWVHLGLISPDLRTVALAPQVEDNDNDNDTLRSPTSVDGGLALQAGVMTPRKKSVALMRLALLARCALCAV